MWNLAIGIIITVGLMKQETYIIFLLLAILHRSLFPALSPTLRAFILMVCVTSASYVVFLPVKKEVENRMRTESSHFSLPVTPF